MPDHTDSRGVVRFAAFEVDLRSGELWKHGIRLKLQEQPFRVLAMLLERPGAIVTRDELRARLWPSDTFVDFDHSLNSTMNKLREALSDSAENPRCIETIPRRGYRFLAQVETSRAADRGGSTLGGGLQAPASPAMSWPMRTPLVSALACMLAVAFAALAFWLFKPAPPKLVTRFAMPMPPGTRLDPAMPEIAISPDGTHLVYAALLGSASQFYVRAMDGLEARAIPGTEGAGNPFFSPDGRWIGFCAGGMLKKISPSGGPSVNLADLIGGHTTCGIFGASWSNQGMIAFAREGPVQQVSDAGGSVHVLTRLDRAETINHGPEFLPDGKALLFSIPTNIVSPPKVAVQSLRTGERRELPSRGYFPRYAPSGHIVYSLEESLMAAPFDLRTLAVTGPAVAVIDGVQPWQYSFSRTGSLAYVPRSVPGTVRLVWVDRKGAEDPVPAPAHKYVFPRISPDGQRLAVAVEEPDSQIWTYDLARRTLARLTLDGTSNQTPAWTPDGKRIVFKGAANRLYWQSTDGSGTAEELTSSPLAPNNFPGSWSPDGQALVFVEQAPPAMSLWILSLNDRKPQEFSYSPSRETAPRFSPDGHWIAYDSNESGRDEIYVRPYPGPGGKWQISTEGGSEPVWNPKGRELFYRNGDKMMVVEVTTQPAFSPGEPRLLFEGAYVHDRRSSPDYDVSPDGQRFLMLKSNENGQAPEQINAVLNWFEELKRRVPTGTK